MSENITGQEPSITAAQGQPSKSEAYSAEGNPVTSNPYEEWEALKSSGHARSPYAGNTRGPKSENPDTNTAVPSSLGRGIRDPGRHDGKPVQAGIMENENVNSEQMATLAEGKTADAVERKPGTQQFRDEDVKFDDFSSDMDRLAKRSQIDLM